MIPIVKYVRLKSRDLKLLHDLWLVKYLNSGRICKLYGNYKSTLRRLKQLDDYGYIRVVDHLYTGENVYGITKKGCGVIGVEYTSVPKTDKIMHSLACSDLYFYLKGNGSIVKDFLLEQKYRGFRIDCLVETDRKIMVEIDLSNRRFESKVKNWEEWYSSGKYLSYFDKYPPVLIVSTNVEKVKNIINREKSIDLNYAYKDYDEIREWRYEY